MRFCSFDGSWIERGARQALSWKFEIQCLSVRVSLYIAHRHEHGMGKIENKGEKECSHFSLLSVEVSNQVIQASISDHTKGKAISDEIIYANEIQVISPKKKCSTRLDRASRIKRAAF